MCLYGGCILILARLKQATHAQRMALEPRSVGRGVDFVHDSIGRDTFMKSIECMRPCGLIVSYGNDSRKADALVVAGEKISFS